MVATQHYYNNMVATQHGSSTTWYKQLLGSDNSTKGKKVETTTNVMISISEVDVNVRCVFSLSAGHQGRTQV